MLQQGKKKKRKANGTMVHGCRVKTDRREKDTNNTAEIKQSNGIRKKARKKKYEQIDGW